MKAVLAIAALVSVVVAQGTTQLPACAATCYANAFSTGANGNCGQTDVACLCANTAFVQSVTTCVTSGCQGADLAAAAAYGQAQCAAVSASASLPPAASSSIASIIVSASSAAASSAPSSARPSSMSAPPSSMPSMSASMSKISSVPVPPPNSGANKVVAGAGLFGAAAVAALLL